MLRDKAHRDDRYDVLLAVTTLREAARYFHLTHEVT